MTPLEAQRAGWLPGWERAYLFQREAAPRVASGERQGLWAATGTGKTMILLTAWGLIGLPFPLLVVTKALGKHAWTRDAAWTLPPDYAPGILVDGAAQSPGVHSLYGRTVYSDLKVALSERAAVVVNYEILEQRHEELLDVPWRVVVLDEVHEIKGGHRPAKKRDGSFHLLRYHRMKQLTTLTRARRGRVWTATATPIVDRRRDLFAQLDIASPGCVGSSYAFLTRFCDGHIDEWGALRAEGATKTPELLEVLGRLFVVITKEQVADQLPPVTWDVQLVEYDPNLMAYAGGSLETALDRTAEMKKAWVLDKAADYLAEGLKVAVLTGRRRIASRLAYELTSARFARRLPRDNRERYSVICTTGDTPAAKRVLEIGEFNARPRGPAALVATFDSLRDSVDIQQTDGVIIGQLPDRPGVLQQLIGRFQRLRGRPVTLHVPIVERTIDEAYRERVIGKLMDVESLGAATEKTALSGLRSGDYDEDSILMKLVEDLRDLEG